MAFFGSGSGGTTINATNGTIPKRQDATTYTDSLVSEAGSAVTINGNLTFSGASRVVNVGSGGSLNFGSNVLLTGTANKGLTIEESGTSGAKLTINQSGLSANREQIVPNGAGTWVLDTFAQTLTNKTLALGSNTVSGTLAQFNTAVTDADLARTDAAQDFTGNQSVGLGATAAPTAFVVGDTGSASPRGIMPWQASTDTNGARFHFRKNRGTFGTPTVVVTGDTLGKIVASGYDGASHLEMAEISFEATGTIASTRVPTRILFKTATNAAPSVLTTALTLGADQSAAFSAGATFNNDIVTAGAVQAGAGQPVKWNGRSKVTSTADGTVVLRTSADVTNQMFSAGVAEVQSGGMFAFSSSSSDASASADAALARPQAGVVEVNNGTAGQSGVLLLRGRTFANLPASPITGMMATVTDSNTTTWGATIAGGGANTVLAFWNGSAWTVAAK